MKVAQLIERRQPNWRELEVLCGQINKKSGKRDPQVVARFSELYRAACADLALAEAYQLPPKTVDYLHRLVARAHNQLYRSRSYQWKKWYSLAVHETPRRIFNDSCVHFVFLVFWGLFFISGYLAYEDQLWPDFAADVIGEKQLEQFEEMYTGFGTRSVGGNYQMTGFYIFNNAGIGLSCFVWMLLILPGLVALTFNAVYLGAVFGYMFRPDMGDAGLNFKNFVTAHGPFELTAIVLAAGAGLKIGLSWLNTGGLSRFDSLAKTARETLPVAMCAVILFVLAALIEGFVSPLPESVLPWRVKGLVGVASSCCLMVYFVCLGYPRRQNTPGGPLF
ncbi:MAG: stage II sporulation protein M [Mariniblastus sp.]|nr:stage II sporulation protein M [Mariniblastus sp.]